MTTESGSLKGSTVGSLVVAALFVVLGAITLYDTMSYGDVDSKVFPRASAILLIVASIISIVLTLLKPVADEGFGTGSWWRRVLLVASMIAACIIMPRYGFVIASAVAFLGALIAAMHDTWSLKTAALYIVSGAIVVGGFYSLFRFGLSVPLP